jgi:ornithine carbamoyltransferase
MKHFINLKDIPAKDLRKIIVDTKKRKKLREKLKTYSCSRTCFFKHLDKHFTL